jgi:hypothetical protein
MNCVSETILRAYVDGEVSGAERAEIEAHLASCTACEKRRQEMAAASARVQEQLRSLDGGAAESSADARAALSRFKAKLESAADTVPAHSTVAVFSKRWRPVWVGAVAASILLCSLLFPSGRSLAQRFLATLRVEKVQPIRLDFSSLDGNRPLQEMLRQMLSDKVVVTADEKSKEASTVADASQQAGFPVRLVGGRTDVAKFSVEGRHAFHMEIDRARMQDIFEQAGHPNLMLPATIDGATVSVDIPRSVRVEYGDCPHRHGDEGEAARHKDWSNCLALEEAPSPAVNLPANLNIQQWAEIGFQLTGMSATQARELGQTIDWKSTLVLPIPRAADSYSQVEVNGVQGTLIKGSGRRGPDYVLIWVKGGIIYGLVGHGDASNAVALANSLS